MEILIAIAIGVAMLMTFSKDAIIGLIFLAIAAVCVAAVAGLIGFAFIMGW